MKHRAGKLSSTLLMAVSLSAGISVAVWACAGGQGQAIQGGNCVNNSCQQYSYYTPPPGLCYTVDKSTSYCGTQTGNIQKPAQVPVYGSQCNNSGDGCQNDPNGGTVSVSYSYGYTYGTCGG